VTEGQIIATLIGAIVSMAGGITYLFHHIRSLNKLINERERELQTAWREEIKELLGAHSTLLLHTNRTLDALTGRSDHGSP